MTESRRMRWAWHGKITHAYEILATNLGGNDHLGELDVNGSTILQWTRRKENTSTGSGQGPVVGSCEHGTECSNSIKRREFHTILTMVKMSKLQMSP
jgi:hypothetical protein